MISFDFSRRGNPPISEDAKFKILDKGDKSFINPWSSEVIKIPSRHLLIGASETGKSYAVCNFLLHEKNPYVYPYGKTLYMIHPTSKGQVKLENTKSYLNEISRQGQGDYDSFTVLVERNIDNAVGQIMATVTECEEKHLNFLLIIDDAYGTDTTRSNFLVELYVKGRHKNISVMFLTQVAMSNKVMKDIRRNINYLWFFRSYEEDADNLIKQMVSAKYPERRAMIYEKYKAVIDLDNSFGFIVYCPFIKANQIRTNTFFPEGARPKSDSEFRTELKQAARAEADAHKTDPVDSGEQTELKRVELDSESSSSDEEVRKILIRKLKLLRKR